VAEKRWRIEQGAVTIYVDTTLADEMAGFITEAGPSSCDAIARTLKRRRRDVLDALRSDERFRKTGQARYVRWHLAVQIDGDGNGPDRDGFSSAPEGSDTAELPKPAESLSARCSNPAGHRAAMATWLDEDGVRRCILCGDMGESKPLTREEYERGEGGEARRERFEADFDALFERRATPEIRDRIRYALGLVS
jgi:hypothetical protein